MEDILEIYHRPYGPDFPLVCMDEQSIQLIEETRIPIPVTKNHPKIFDLNTKGMIQLIFSCIQNH